MFRRQSWAWLAAAAALLSTPVFGQGPTPEPAARGRTPLAAPQDDFSYAKKWALIIGVNYAGRNLTDVQDQMALPQLKNAVQDALSLAALLQSHYGYDPDTTFVLTEQEAEDQAIRDLLGKLCDPAVVQPDHSVLVFFAGHGVRIDGDQAERAAIYPYDVQLSRGKPISRFIELHKHVFDKLRSCPARHKLLILDNCYSGEIFNLNFRPRSETDDRGAESLFGMPCIQAMASCRASQVASDGDGEHSPFTQALLDGLQRLPARDRSTRLWANRLFAYMRPRVRQDTGQNPDCRNLDGDGEFYFLPDDHADFSQFLNKVADFRLLQATVASEQGNWWFEEMPWFIPALREKILEKDQPTRASLYAAQINRTLLLKLAKETAEEHRRHAQAGSDDALQALRSQHLLRLLKAEKKRAELQTELASIEQDLVAAELRPRLEAADLHLLAVVQHALNREEAAQAYEAALAAYQAADATEEGRAGASKALHSLCLADYGEYLLDKQLATEAAERFQQAGALFDIDPPAAANERPATADAADSAEASAAAAEAPSSQERTRHFSDAPPAFRIFIHCREADAWLRVNRWALANRRLQDARDAAEEFDTEHFLAAYVHSRRAWAEMIQWRIADAKASFLRSNAILGQIINSDRADRGPQAAPEEPADRPPSLLPAEADSQPSHAAPAANRGFALDAVFRQSTAHHAKVAFFHNLHGLAMAQRFQGDSAGAARTYRWLVGEIELALAHLRTSASQGDYGAEATLLARFTNSQERLGDCNLFAAPEARDLKEAYDDYRRALNRIHLLGGPPEERARGRATLLYKQALVLSLPSAIQDLGLARVMCDEADRVYQLQTLGQANGLFRGLGQLTSRVLAVIEEDAAPAGLPPAQALTPIALLRQTLLEFRDEIGQNPHRDQLELCLFAARALVEHGCPDDRFYQNEDADLLLSFCRLALDPYRSDGEAAAASGDYGEARAYLRPYYDAAMRCKLANEPRHVKSLLEIQWEATRGTYFVKQEHAAPTLAIYRLDDNCYLLFDLPGPRGVSKCLSLGESYGVNSITTACQDVNQRLPLPYEVSAALLAWRAALGSNEPPPTVCCYWEDPVRRVAQRPIATAAGAERADARPASHFPFRLPDGLEPAERTIAATPP